MVGYELPLIIGGIAAVSVAVASKARSVTPYAYIMAKMRAWESRMLSDAKMRSLSESGSIPDFINGLRDTDYQEDLEGQEEEVEMVERALSRHLLDTYQEIFPLLPEETRDFFQKFSERLDMGNLSLVVQAAAGRVDRDVVVSHLVDGVSFRRERLEVMSGSEGIEELVEHLSETSYYQDLRPYLEPGEGDAQELMRAIRHSFYVSLWRKSQELGRKNRSIARDLVGLEIDLENVKLILRLKLNQLPADVIMKNVIPVDCNLTQDLLRSCAQAEDLEEVKSVLLKSPLRSILGEVFESARDQVAEVERLLQEALLNHGKMLSLSKPLTIATPLFFLYQKHAEVQNLRGVARGVADGLESEDIERTLVGSGKIE